MCIRDSPAGGPVLCRRADQPDGAPRGCDRLFQPEGRDQRRTGNFDDLPFSAHLSFFLDCLNLPYRRRRDHFRCDRYYYRDYYLFYIDSL